MFAPYIVAIRFDDRPQRDLPHLRTAAHDDDALTVDPFHTVDGLQIPHHGKFPQIAKHLVPVWCGDFEEDPSPGGAVFYDRNRPDIAIVRCNHAGDSMQNSLARIRFYQESMLLVVHLEYHRKVTRRELFLSSAAVLAASRMQGAKTRITKSNISAITDEIGKTQADAIAFAKQYGMEWVELRGVPETKKSFDALPEAELRQHAADLKAAGLKVSFLNTGLLKFAWPGMVDPRQRPETDAQKAKRLDSEKARWDSRLTDLERALKAANILGVDKMRIFSGTRVAEPETVLPLVQKTVEEMLPLAEKYKVRLLMENENSQNIGKSSELKPLMDRIPSKWLGFNWDPQNAHHLNELQFPDGYKSLPFDRMLNAQFKAVGLLETKETLPWKDMLLAMQADGYKHCIGLETHIFDGTLIEKAHASMQIIMKMVGELN